MKTLNSTLAIVLSYALVITPAFGQSEESSSEEQDASSQSEEGSSEERDATSEAVPGPDEPSEAATESSTDQDQPKKKRKAVEDGPGAPPRGTGKLVGGIVTASVGTGLGILFLALASVDCNSINKDDANSSDVAKQEKRKTDVKDCKDQQPQAQATGIVFLAAGLGVGLPLLYFGIQDRKVYNQWKEGQPVQDDSAFVPGKASLVFLPNAQDSFSPGINFSYQF